MQTFTLDDDHLDQARHSVPDFEKLIKLFVVFDDQEPAFGVVDQIFQLTGGIRGVDARANTANALHTHVGVHPFLVVFRQDRNHFAPLEAKRHKPKADAFCAGVVVRPRMGPPDAKGLFAHRGAVAQFLASFAEKLGGRVLPVDIKRALRQVCVKRQTMHGLLWGQRVVHR